MEETYPSNYLRLGAGMGHPPAIFVDKLDWERRVSNFFYWFLFGNSDAKKSAVEINRLEMDIST